MTRPVGVIAAAIVAILGSTIMLLLAFSVVAGLLMGFTPPEPSAGTQFVIGGVAMYATFGGIGVWTSVGGFRLRPWARMSILIFAGFLVAGSMFGLVMTMFVPVPAEFTAGTARSFRQIAAATFGIPLAIGVWWLIQFNTRSTKAAFAAGTDSVGSQRPVSITAIALIMLVGGAFFLVSALSRAPAFLFGATFNGWTAAILYAFLAALSLYIGKALLDLREEARLLAIGWFGFGAVHACVVTLVPALRHRLHNAERVAFQYDANSTAFDPAMATTVMFASTAIVTAACIWFLIRDRGAFGRLESV